MSDLCLQCPLAECNEKDPRCLIRPKRKENVSYLRRIAKATDEEIIALYQSGLSMKKTAQLKGLSHYGVSTILDYNGIERRPRKRKVKADRGRGRPKKRDERFITFLVSVIVKAQDVVVKPSISTESVV